MPKLVTEVNLRKLRRQQFGKVVCNSSPHLDSQFNEWRDFTLRQIIVSTMRVQKLEQTCHGLLYCVLIAASHRTHINPGIYVRLEIATAKFRKDLSKVIRQEAVTRGVVVWPDLGDFPPWKISVDSVEKRGVLEFREQWLKKMSVPTIWLPNGHIRIDVSAENDRALGREFLVPAIELSSLHVILEHVEARLDVIKAYVRNLIEEDEMLEADDTELAGVAIVKQVRRGRVGATA